MGCSQSTPEDLSNLTPNSSKSALTHPPSTSVKSTPVSGEKEERLSQPISTSAPQPIAVAAGGKSLISPLTPSIQSDATKLPSASVSMSSNIPISQPSPSSPPSLSPSSITLTVSTQDSVSSINALHSPGAQPSQQQIHSSSSPLPSFAPESVSSHILSSSSVPLNSGLQFEICCFCDFVFTAVRSCM